MRLWCQHRNQTTPRRDEEGEYRRCLECGARIGWGWRERTSFRPRLFAGLFLRGIFFRMMNIEKLENDPSARSRDRRAHEPRL
jgi:hypothetical protein